MQRFFNTDVGQRFFLTGGTALAAFHLHHRLSDDLDLFTLDDDTLIGVDHQIEEIASQLDWGIVRARRAEHFRQFHFAPRAPQFDGVGTSLQVDMVRDFGPQYGQRQVVGGIAGALLQVNRLTRLPKMKRSLDLLTLQAFFTSIANEMLDRLNPDIDERSQAGTLM